jgi:uncharacterized membrane protein
MKDAIIIALSFCVGAAVSWSSSDRVLTVCIYFITFVSLSVVAMVLSPRLPMPDVRCKT